MMHLFRGGPLCGQRRELVEPPPSHVVMPITPSLRAVDWRDVPDATPIRIERYERRYGGDGVRVTVEYWWVRPVRGRRGRGEDPVDRVERRQAELDREAFGS